MERSRASSVFRYLAYAIEIILFYILCSTPGIFPEILGGRPSFLIVIAITISVFEKEIPSMIIGLVCGLLIDMSFSASIGAFTISLTIICFILGYVANNIIVVNIWNVLLTSLIIVAVVFSIHFVFSYLVKNYGYAGEYYTNHYISRIVYTFIFTPIFYIINKFIYSSLVEEN